MQVLEAIFGATTTVVLPSIVYENKGAARPSGTSTSSTQTVPIIGVKRVRRIGSSAVEMPPPAAKAAWLG